MLFCDAYVAIKQRKAFPKVRGSNLVDRKIYLLY